MKNLSVIILARNEEVNIGRAIDSVAFANEIFILDDHSTDKTKLIATKIRTKIMQYTGKDDFAKRRNYALSQVNTNWVLFIDADEELSTKVREEIRLLPDNTTKSAYSVKRIDYFWGKKISHGELHNAQFSRLVHRNRGKFVRPVHERWEANGMVGHLQGEIRHYPHQTVTEFLNAVNHYSTINAQYYFDIGRKTSAIDILLTPCAKFFYTYFILLGFLDGVGGFKNSQRLEN